MHARFLSKTAFPKITFGKMIQHGDQLSMPVSIHVHHALMDGYHAGQFVELFQDAMSQ